MRTFIRVFSVAASLAIVVTALGRTTVADAQPAVTPAAPTAGRQWTVSRTGGADFTDISSALEAAEAGDVIRVAQGRYAESLRIGKDVKIFGAGERPESVVIEARRAPCAVIDAPRGELRNMTLRFVGNERKNCIDINGGHFTIAESRISSAGASAIAARNGAAPVLSDNWIGDSAEAGVLVTQGARGELRNNVITGNGKAGVAITKGGAPLLVGNVIELNRTLGVVVTLGAAGVLRENRIVRNGEFGVHVTRDSAPELEGNEVLENGQAGLLVALNGGGRYIGNRIVANRGGGVVIQSGADPTLEGNAILRNQGDGVLIQDYGRGRFKTNRIEGNQDRAWNIGSTGRPLRYGEP